MRKKIGSNMYEERNSAGIRFFSYETPVAFINNKGLVFVTTEYYSKTTTKHINKWLEKIPRERWIKKEPSFFIF